MWHHIACMLSFERGSAYTCSESNTSFWEARPCIHSVGRYTHWQQKQPSEPLSQLWHHTQPPERSLPPVITEKVAYLMTSRSAIFLCQLRGLPAMTLDLLGMVGVDVPLPFMAESHHHLDSVTLQEPIHMDSDPATFGYGGRATTGRGRWTSPYPALAFHPQLQLSPHLSPGPSLRSIHTLP